MRLILFLLIIECIKLRVVKISQKKRFELNEDLVPDNRKMNYYMSIIYEYVVAKDIRIFNLTGFILRKLESYNDIVYKKYRNTFRKLGNYSVFSGIITLFQKIVMYACMVSEVISNKISIGYFTMYVNAANTFSKSISGFWGSFIHFRQMLKYLENYIKFDNIPDNSNEQEVDIDFNEEFTIEFKHVYYKYPRSEAYALEDVNVKIQKGEVVAVVGENGAGKTTFIKLLCRLYQPEKGEILINNVNINEFSDEQYNKLIAVVFQDFKIYAFDIRENILFGQTALDEKVHEVLEDVGLDSKVQKLDKGLDTSLHKYFEKDGIELSGGEGQKLAIARAMYRNSPLVILDEPTAALDPYAESEIFTNTFKLMDKKTTIFVSHRLSSCKLTNHIVVFDNGRVIEEGTHDNLLQANKKYAQLWNAQAQYYN